MPRIPPTIVDVPVEGDNPQPRAPRNVPPPPEAEPTPQAKTPVKRTPADRRLATKISATYQTVAAGMTAFGMHRGELVLTEDGPVMSGPFMKSGDAFMNNADALAEQWMQLADNNPKVKAWLKRVTETSAMAGLIGIHFTCVLPFVIPMLPPQVQMMMGHENGNGTFN